MNARAQRIAAAGLAALSEPTSADAAWVNAIAAMIEAATHREPRPRKATVGGHELAYAQLAVARFQTELEGEVLMTPVHSNWVYRLRAVLSNMLDFTADDIGLVLDWVKAGGVAGWKTKPTFEHAIQHWPKWTAYAREWNNRGRQSLQGHQPEAVAAPSWSEFR